MTWTKLGDPVPRETVDRYVPYEWPAGEIAYLPLPAPVLLPSLDEIVTIRRTRRLFEPLTQDSLSAMLWLSSRVISVGDETMGFPLTQRPAPSAGAIHPIHLLLKTLNADWARYDPYGHGLVQLGKRGDALKGLWEAIARTVDPGAGTAFLFAAEPGKTSAKYANAESLVWRDAGALVGHMALVAESLHLNFCPLGHTGEPWVSGLDEQDRLIGVGVALLGNRPKR
jgi:SagB-type dehydrogenase family enzyme